MAKKVMIVNLTTKLVLESRDEEVTFIDLMLCSCFNKVNFRIDFYI